jgi:hypothetical protein
MQLPRRIILSRKGVDESAGRFSSLICDGSLLSIPIPETEFEHSLTYEDVLLPPGPWEGFGNFGELVNQLNSRRGAPLRSTHPVHLDPDIRPDLHGDQTRCRSALGQCCAFDAELGKVEKQDLFLFFGWFAEHSIAGRTLTRRGRDEHTIWGWLQTDQPTRNVTPQASPSHAHEHRRLARDAHAGGHNSLYPALRHLTFLPDVAGCGAFSRWRAGLRLTHPACRQGCRSLWRLPSFFFERLSGTGDAAIWVRDGESAVVQIAGARTGRQVAPVPLGARRVRGCCAQSRWRMDECSRHRRVPAR